MTDATNTAASAEAATNVFDSNSTNTQSTSSEGILSSLVGEGKKFKTVEDLAKAKMESDRFIEQLKQENSEVRREMEAMASARESLEEIKRVTAERSQSTNNQNSSVTSTQDVSELIDAKIRERDEARSFADNVQYADETATKFFGSKEKAKAVVEAKAKELGVPVSWLADMAGKNPKAALSLLGVTNSNVQQTQSSSVTATSNGGGVNTDRVDFAPQGIEQGSKAYYDKMRRENPKLYFSPKVQNEIFKAAQEGKYK